MKALDNVISPFKIYELRKRILFTLAMIAIYRLGAYIPTPGVDGEALSKFFMAHHNTLLGFFNLFTGGALENFSVFGLGIMPYISASIIMSLLTAAVPRFERLRKEGEIGHRKINQYTRYLTLAIGVVQALGLSLYMQAERVDPNRPIVITPGLGFCAMTVLTLTSGTAFVMWLGEQITERGIGNGSSILIFANIIAALPSGVARFVQQMISKEISPFNCLLLIGIIAVTIPLVIVMLQGHRKITVQYAKRIIGRRMYGGQSSYIPLQLNSAGVIPVIFASSALAFFGSFTTFISPKGALLSPIVDFFRTNIPGWVGALIYNLIYVAGIIFFTYFYTAVVFNPQDISENIRKGGGFIPGIRPGRPTADYIERILKRVTFVGAIFLAAVALLPQFLISHFHVPFYFGGTSLLIVIGVALDTLRQIESHLLMSRYEGFIKKAKLRGRF